MEMTTILIREEDSFRRAALLRLFITGTRLLSIDELWTASLGSEQPISTEDAATLGLIGAEMTSLLTEFESLVPILAEHIQQNADFLDQELERAMPGTARFADDLARMRSIVESRGGLAAFGAECCEAFLGVVASEREELNRKIAQLEAGSSPSGDLSHDAQCAALGTLFVIAIAAAPPAAIGIAAVAIVGRECF